ncbi:hypothetical protein HBA54_22475 [Pelagibius litoralis]|uniref:Uncharacterized protein n=1 Tax=Pelagibius litoralis TaxID=374515 RepID=A0A967F1E6_9PROT|nr:hypothetical protein [Pelagibius litoralis]NIA71366.1 hypothetical protein [Pelagibius litoralis]
MVANATQTVARQAQPAQAGVSRSINDVVQHIMEYPMSHVVAKFAEKHDIASDVAQEYEKELKRYFVLTTLNPQYDYGMAGPVDDLWHEFILYTREYHVFCQQCVGRYLHHFPERMYDANAKGDNVESNDTVEWYGKFLTDYTVLFGEKPPAHVWPDIRSFPAATMSLCRACGTDPGGPDDPDPSDPDPV